MKPEAILKIYRINWLKRYSTSNVHNPQNVSSHSHGVAFLVEVIGDLENLKRKDEDKINIEIALRKAINHDIGEAEFGDLIKPIKEHNEEFYKIVKEVENTLTEETIIAKVPKELREKYREYIIGCKEGVEGKLVDLADLMECLLYSLSEKKLGNEGFIPIFHNTIEMIIEKGYHKMFPTAKPIIKYLKKQMSGD